MLRLLLRDFVRRRWELLLVGVLLGSSIGFAVAAEFGHWRFYFLALAMWGLAIFLSESGHSARVVSMMLPVPRKTILIAAWIEGVFLFPVVSMFGGFLFGLLMAGAMSPSIDLPLLPFAALLIVGSPIATGLTAALLLVSATFSRLMRRPGRLPGTFAVLMASLIVLVMLSRAEFLDIFTALGGWRIPLIFGAALLLITASYLPIPWLAETRLDPASRTARRPRPPQPQKPIMFPTRWRAFAAPWLQKAFFTLVCALGLSSFCLIVILVQTSSDARPGWPFVATVSLVVGMILGAGSPVIFCVRVLRSLPLRGIRATLYLMSFPVVTFITLGTAITAICFALGDLAAWTGLLPWFLAALSGSFLLQVFYLGVQAQHRLTCYSALGVLLIAGLFFISGEYLPVRLSKGIFTCVPLTGIAFVWLHDLIAHTSLPYRRPPVTAQIYQNRR